MDRDFIMFAIVVLAGAALIGWLMAKPYIIKGNDSDE